MTRIGQVAGLYPPHLGGEEIVAERLAHLQSSHADVTVFTSNLGAPTAPRVERGPRLLILRHRALRILNTPVAPGMLFSLLTRRPKPDLLHVHTGQALIPEMVVIAAKVRRIPYIAHIHLIVQPSSRPGRLLLPLYYRLSFRRFLRGAEAVVCLTEAMRDEVRVKWGIDDDKLLVIPNGVDATVFRRSGERSPRELLAVGRLTPQKNLGVLLSAFAILSTERKAAGEPPLSLRVIGDGEEMGSLGAQAAALNLDHVVFEGRQPAAAVAAALARATVLVMPSTHEGFPLVLLEAMAAGTPVVASALPEIIEAGGDAVLPVEPVTPQHLAEVLRHVLADEQLRADLSDRGTARARSFSWEAANAQVIGLYATVLRTDGPRVGAER